MDCEAYREITKKIFDKYNKASSMEEKLALGRDLYREVVEKCVDKEEVIWLEDSLRGHIPELSKYFDAARQEWPLDFEYSIFSHVVRPYIDQLRKYRRAKALQEIWSLLEELASSSKFDLKSSLFVMMEELDLHHFDTYMGPKLRRQWFIQMSCFARWTENGIRHNYDIDRPCYYKRWKEEIERAGGFGRLTYKRIGKITDKIWNEFGIERISHETLVRLGNISHENKFEDDGIIAAIL